jgi:hypothetical protein
MHQEFVSGAVDQQRRPSLATFGATDHADERGSEAAANRRNPRYSAEKKLVA